MTESNVRRPKPLDTVIMVATPENVAFEFRLAGPFPRFVALFVDLALLGVTLAIFAVLLGLFGDAGSGLFLFAAFVGWWGYGALMETLLNGQTLGKKALGIRVVADSGLAINAGQALLRNILRYADLLPPVFPGVASMFLTRRFQRLGDLAAETIVVIDGARLRPHPPRGAQLAREFRERIPTRFRPDSALVDALAAYVGRRNDLSTARRRELANTLAEHFIRAWSLPPNTDPDLLLCALYDRATMDHFRRDDDELPASGVADYPGRAARVVSAAKSE
ncbi:RDD family protein [Schlesneria paludicola]|uniref:RDD family protein n=1 Tax=Schlesneria paludicola TaxID=360056 RepID=UPI00029A813E|nr:RDD family protein [Schlesneria paludicola]